MKTPLEKHIEWLESKIQEWKNVNKTENLALRVCLNNAKQIKLEEDIRKIILKHSWEEGTIKWNNGKMGATHTHSTFTPYNLNKMMDEIIKIVKE